MKTPSTWTASPRIGLMITVLAGALGFTLVGAAHADFNYVVQPGDSLARIAVRTHTTIATLIALNQPAYPCLAIRPSCLQIGWTLVLPGTPTPGSAGTYTVRNGDSLVRIAAGLGTTVQALIAANQTRFPCLVSKPECLQTGWVIAVPGNKLVTAAPMPSPAADGDGAYWEVRLVIAAEVNRARQDNGLAALVWDSKVAGLAQLRSADMATRNYLSHFDPQTGVLLSAQLMRPAGYSTGCENLYSTQGRSVNEIPSVSVSLWMSSAGHRACVLNGTLTLMGTGVAQAADGKWYVTLLNTR